MSPYLASVMSIPKYFPKCLAISSVTQPKNPTEASAAPTPLLELKPRQPRVIDPVSGQLIAPSAFENYVFYSPDGSCHVGTKSEGKMSSISNIEYKHIFENRYISSQEYWEYSKLNIPPVTNASDKVQEARLQLMLDHPSWFVNRFKNTNSHSGNFRSQF